MSTHQVIGLAVCVNIMVFCTSHDKDHNLEYRKCEGDFGKDVKARQRRMR
jgi:hypothetical protein